MKFHHVGIACSDIEAETQKIADLHGIVEKSPIVFDKEQNARLILLTLPDGTHLELISGPQVETFLKKRITYYHLCFEVADLAAEIERLVTQDALLISPPKPALLFDNREVAFLEVSYGLIELLSEK